MELPVESRTGRVRATWLQYSNYSSKLLNFLIENNYNYNPNSYVYSQENLWYDEELSFTRDLSVASWMESSAKVASKFQDKPKDKWPLHRAYAEAIDYDHVDCKYYNWRLMPVEAYGGIFQFKYHYKIKRYQI